MIWLEKTEMSINKETDMESCKKQTVGTFENSIILWAYAREFQWEE
jgi:hypothetical protein